MNTVIGRHFGMTGIGHNDLGTMTIPSGNFTYMAPVLGNFLLGASMGPIYKLGTLVGHRQSLQVILKSWLCPSMTLVGRWDP